MPSVRKIHDSKIHGRAKRAHTASARPSMSAAAAKENTMEKPT